MIKIYLQSCITTNWHSIALVKFGNGLRVKFNNTVVTFENGTTSVHKSGLYQSGKYHYPKFRVNREWFDDNFNVIFVPKDATVVLGGISGITTCEICPSNEYCSSDYHCCQKNDYVNFYCCPDTTDCGLNNDCI